MGWQERAAHYFPRTHLDNPPDRSFRRSDNPPRANVPSVPSLSVETEVGTLGPLARDTLSGQSQHDAHISNWIDWSERAAIIEFEAHKSRRDAERAAIQLHHHNSKTES